MTQPPESIGRIRVLVADDSRDNAQSMALPLGMAGCDRHFVKPIEFGALEEILAKLAARTSQAQGALAPPT